MTFERWNELGIQEEMEANNEAALAAFRKEKGLKPLKIENEKTKIATRLIKALHDWEDNPLFEHQKFDRDAFIRNFFKED